MKMILGDEGQGRKQGREWRVGLGRSENWVSLVKNLRYSQGEIKKLRGDGRGNFF